MPSKWVIMLQMTLLRHTLLSKKSRPLLMSDSLQHPAYSQFTHAHTHKHGMHMKTTNRVLSDLLQTRLLHLQIQDKTSKQNKTK